MVPNHDAHWFEIYGKVARTGEAVRFESPAKAMERYYDVFAFRMGGDGSRRVGVLFNDITERKRVAEALRQSEACLKEAAQLANIGYWERDLVADCITWSDEVYRIWGQPRQDRKLSQAELEKTIHPDDRHLQKQALTEAAKGSRRYDVEYRIVQPGGEIRFVHVRDQIEYGDAGQPIRIFGVIQDITERKQAEMKIQMFSQQIIATRENERKRVSSALHHDVSSLAVGIAAHLDAIEQELRAGKPGEALKWMKRTRKLFDESAVRLKKLAVELRPPELDVLGLCAALRQHFAQVTERAWHPDSFPRDLGAKASAGRHRHDSVPGGAGGADERHHTWSRDASGRGPQRIENRSHAEGPRRRKGIRSVRKNGAGNLTHGPPRDARNGGFRRRHLHD